MELLVAITILVIVMTSSMVIFRGVTRAWQTGQLRTERYQQARLLFDLFAREISSCTVNTHYPFLGLNAGAGAPLKSGSQQDELFFVATLPGRGGLVERGYWVNAAGDLVCHDDEPADGDYAATGRDELCGNDIQGFDVRYFNGMEWFDQWDSRPGGPQAEELPKALQVTVTIGREHPESFDIIIAVPTSSS